MRIEHIAKVIIERLKDLPDKELNELCKAVDKEQIKRIIKKLNGER